MSCCGGGPGVHATVARAGLGEHGRGEVRGRLRMGRKGRVNVFLFEVKRAWGTVSR